MHLNFDPRRLALGAGAVLTLSAGIAASPATAQAAPCNSQYFSDVRAGSELGQFKYVATPTTRSRWGTSNRQVHGEMWADLTRCVPPPALSPAQRDSLLQQLACHAEYGYHEQFGGPTWDIEAHRPPLPPGEEYEALSHKCNWNGPGDASDSGSS